MARNRRDKDVSQTKVKKKTKDTKKSLANEIRSCVDSYAHLYVFSIDNMRSKNFLKVRQHFKNSSRFFYGRNAVMAVALGRDKPSEHAQGLHKVSRQLQGQRGLLFTNEPLEKIRTEFAELSEVDYARAGDTATETVDLPVGPLPQFAFSMEPQLRKLGFPTKLDKGVVSLHSDFHVCGEGDVLSVEQAKMLKILEYKMATFEVRLLCQWSKEGGLRELDDGNA